MSAELSNNEVIAQIKNAVLLLTVLPFAYFLGVSTNVPNLTMLGGALLILSVVAMFFGGRFNVGFPIYVAALSVMVQFLYAWYEIKGDTEPDHIMIGIVWMTYSAVLAILFLCTSCYVFKNLSSRS